MKPDSGTAQAQSLPDDALLDTKEAARFLCLSPSKLAKARVAGDGPPYVKLGRAVRYFVGDLRAYARRHRRLETMKSNRLADPS